MEEIFNAIEELVGTYPTGDNLRNAIHAIITRDVSWDMDKQLKASTGWNTTGHGWIESIAKAYEQNRGTTQMTGKEN